MLTLVPTSPDARLREAAQAGDADLPPLAEAMTAADLRRHERALTQLLGGAHAEVSISVSRGGHPDDHNATVFLYPDGLRGPSFKLFQGGTWRDAIERARAWAVEARANLADARTRKMSLAIIEASGPDGVCLEGALRAAGFTLAEIAEFGEAACDRADAMCRGKSFALLPTVSP